VKILVTGAAGQLARAVVDAFDNAAEVEACTRAELDISDLGAVRGRISGGRHDAIINCAAYNDVDRAEEEPMAAMTVNAFGVRVLARAAAEANAALVHYSSDFVFDGRTTRPYTEDDVPNPGSVYATSKLLGEWFARDAPRAFILRVESLFGGQAARSSIDRIIDAIHQGREARVFVDRTVSPSYVADVADATRVLVERGQPGLYHCVSSGCCTWYELAQEIAALMGRASEARLVPVSVKDVALRAARPQFAALANDKLARLTPLPEWREALRRYLTQRGWIYTG
jgi:dTDP-4-dehydrorhamnose reductase